MNIFVSDLLKWIDWIHIKGYNVSDVQISKQSSYLVQKRL